MDAAMETQQRQEWSELWKLGSVVIAVLCLTSSVAALILAWLERA